MPDLKSVYKLIGMVTREDDGADFGDVARSNHVYLRRGSNTKVPFRSFPSTYTVDTVTQGRGVQAHSIAISTPSSVKTMCR